MFFENALNNAKPDDTVAITRVVMLATDRPEGTDEVFQAAEHLYLQWLLADEIMSDKKTRSLKNIMDLIDQGDAAVGATLLRNVPEWKDATEGFRKLALAGLKLRLNQIYLAEEHLRARIR